ncbi:uncharacterized protein LOC131610451 isoform X3 [Vicia villosa]|uniref:uncharacterized protein LOC131610451 isoform X3 n=1 Tax=Vicia villosa TaxID=3911 RepID=UPI00273CECF2|nr:uncharacterized protein LOC131610451 isoform X3 [Vicia villosa]
MSAAAPFSPVSTTTTNVKTIFVRLLIQHLAIYDTSEMKRIRLVSAMEITLACGNYFSPPIKKMHVYFCWCLRFGCGCTLCFSYAGQSSSNAKTSYLQGSWKHSLFLISK